MKNIILLLFSSFLYSQNLKIEGRIIDENQEFIKYANIGVVGKTFGTVSDSLGKFTLFLDKTFLADTITISHLGYKSKKILISENTIGTNLTILLEEDNIALEEVTIRSNNTNSQIKEKGRDKINTKRSVQFSISNKKNQNLGAVVGRKFKFSKRKKFALKQVRFYIKHNDFENVKFRINVYNMKKGEPNKTINKKPIYHSLQNKFKGWTSVDISEWNINVNEDIVVGIEWVEYSKNGKSLSLPIIIPSLRSTHFYRYGSQSKWRKFAGISVPMMLQYQEINF